MTNEKIIKDLMDLDTDYFLLDNEKNIISKEGIIKIKEKHKEEMIKKYPNDVKLDQDMFHKDIQVMLKEMKKECKDCKHS